MILLDTHSAIWLVTNAPVLGKQSRSLAEQAIQDRELAISSISFWELAMLIGKGRLKALESPSEQRARILGAGIVEIPLTGDIALLSVELNLHNDPADRFIAATAIAHEAILMTADKNLLRWRHKLKRQNALQ